MSPQILRADQTTRTGLYIQLMLVPLKKVCPIFSCVSLYLSSPTSLASCWLCRAPDAAQYFQGILTLLPGQQCSTWDH